MAASALDTIKVGDHVNKIDGYSYPGVVVAVFDKLSGEQRMVVEFVSPGTKDGEGMLHIFSPRQLFKTDRDNING